MLKPLPRYFEIDGDIYVKVYEYGDDVFGINHWGNPYPPVKALYTGVEVSKKTFDNAVANRQGKPMPSL